jgi:hypothetical protein
MQVPAGSRSRHDAPIGPQHEKQAPRHCEDATTARDGQPEWSLPLRLALVDSWRSTMLARTRLG